LFSAGYFESLIKPIYKELEKEDDFHISQFLEIFDKIVKESPFAIFVNRYMDKDELLSKIRSQITKNRKYGIKFLNVHGIGAKNVKTIREALYELESDEGIEVKNVQERANIIFVNIIIH